MTSQSSLLVLVALAVALSPLEGGVTGRYVRYEAPTEFRDSLWDLEIYSNGTPITGNRTIQAAGHRGDLVPQEKLGFLADGNLAREVEGKRPFGFQTAHGLSNVCIEVDLGRPQELDEVKVTRSQAVADSPRVLTVLDEERKVVASALLKMGLSDKEVVFRPQADGPYVGQVVPEGQKGWLSLTGLLPDYPVEANNLTQRLATFEQRDSPENTKLLAQRFFGLMDLDKPSLENVRALLDRGRFYEALALYREHWLKQIDGSEYVWRDELPDSHYEGEAEDLLAGRFSTLAYTGNRHAPVEKRSHGVMVPFQVGAVPWGSIPGSTDRSLTENFLAWNRGSARANRFARSLLTAYRKTGDKKYLIRWQELTDDLTMNFSEAADASSEECRDYFIKDTLQEWGYFLSELSDTARAQPQFAKTLSPQTLARLLIFAQEEYLAPYWRTGRKTVFNHTFNALTAAYFTTQSFGDFKAGERLIREIQDHFERVVSYNTTREGSMAEIDDDGHLAMAMRLGVTLHDISKYNPDWISPALLLQLKDRYAEMTRFMVRHLTPNGLLSRGTYHDGAENNTPALGGTGSLFNNVPMYQANAVFQEPEIKAILRSVFKDRPEGEGIRAYYRNETSPPGTPQVVSDFMPYAGLYYLRNRWGDDASSAHMLCQPVSHPSSSPREETRVYFQGKGSPLLDLGGVRVDHAGPDQVLGQPRAKPGSKTSHLTGSSPAPLNVRWHSGPVFDLAEALWVGPYGKPPLSVGENPSHPYGTVHTQRFLIQYRPADLWIAVDRIATNGQGATPKHFRFNSTVVSPAARLPKIGGDGTSLELEHGSFSGMETRFFANRPFTIEPARPRNNREADGAVNMRGSFFSKTREWVRSTFEFTCEGGATLAGITLLQPLVEGTKNVAAQAAPISGLNESATGFAMPLPGGGQLSVFTDSAGPGRFSVGDISAEATLLVVARDANGAHGIVLDAASFRTPKGPASLPAPDFTFALTAQGLTTAPILRPLRMPVISPTAPVFVDSTMITLSSPDKDARIYYTLDGSDPVPGVAGVTEYTGPFPLTESALVKTRAVRNTVTPESFVPFRVDGTLHSAVEYANFEKKDLLPATRISPPAGLRMEFLHDSWLRLFSFLDNPKETPAEKSLIATSLLSPADFTPLRDQDRYFGVRYSGYLDVPVDGVYTFHLPEELADNCTPVPGYDLALSIDGKAWNPDFTWQGRGTWSVALAKGCHPFALTYADVRTREKICPKTGLWRSFPTDLVVWKGEAPVLEVSGPGLEPQPIPDTWLKQPQP